DAASVEGGDEGPRLIRTVFRLGEAVSKGRTSRNLREEMASAGFHSQSAAAVYMGTKLILLVGGAIVLCVLIIPSDKSFAGKLAMIIFGSALLFFIPNIVVRQRRDRRRAEVKKMLPDAVDMLEICVSAGMGIDAAWTAVGDEIRRVSPTFADEMELTNLEVSLGVPRAVAMRHMADRTGAEDLSSLVALLVQSERFGAGIIEALTTFAKTMRETRGQRAEEAAEKMAVKLLFPMVMFIFPALILVMVGPAIIQLSEHMF
ncbi:MAG TPA: type II secretion system F family protein, partial [Planctomycetota bacterium]|nr:type II secretion system F family protein [Planctomycetota bacterium]